jgi:hypothetical protein
MVACLPCCGLASPLPQRTDFDIKVVATVLDTVQELVGRYACLGDNQLYAVTLHNVWASYFNHDWYCTNRPSIDLDFPVPGNINVADILSATVSTSLSPRSAGVRPHDVRILFNGNQVGELLDQVPDGSYTFSVDPAFFNPSANPVQPVNQTLGLRTYHFNGGHYVVNTSSRLDLPLANYTRYVCAANPEEARDKAGQGFWPIPTQVDIQIVQPQAGALLELGWPVVLEATVDDGHESYIYYPVLARIVYSDSPQDVKTVMLVPYSSSGTVDTYRGYWLPARAGEVSITQTVYAGIVSGSDNVVVTVEPEATFSISGQVAWTESGNSISGVAIRPAQGSAPFGEVKTDEQGNYQIVDLPRGSYELTASREGYTFVDAANPNQSTIQVQISEMDASGKNFIAVYEAPQLPDRRFKGAGWLAYIDDTDPLGTGTNYWDTGIGWNVERIEDIGVGNPVPFERVNTFSENGVDTIVRLDDPQRHNRPPGQRGPFPSEGHGIDLNGSCDQIDEAWLARVDHIYTSTISADTGHMLKRFVLANEPNHHTDEWDFSVDEYTFVYNCYYDRWIEHELEPGRPGVRQGLHALYVAGPGHEPGGVNSWETYYPGIFDNIPRADGFTMHVYGYYDGPDSEGDTVFNPWLDTFMAGMANWNQTRGKQKPLIITEYNPGAVCGDVNEPPGGDNNAGWDDWFRQTYCWVRAAQTTYPDAQLKGLIYFVDEPSQERGPDACWNPVSLRQPDNPESTRRQSWLNLNDSTCANARNQSQGFSGALCAPMSNVPIPTSQTKQMPSSSLNLPIGGAISGTLGEWGGDQVYYVTDDLEVAAGETLTIAAGTTLVFSPTTRLIVSGQLLADGNTVFPVRFTSTDQAGWSGIHFQSTASDSWCTGCYLENIEPGGVAFQIESPVTIQTSLIRGVPGGTAISSTVPLTLSHTVIDYVDTGIYLSGQPTQTYAISYLTLNRCEHGVLNRGQTLALDNSILTECSVVVSTELSGTTIVSYTLFHNNGQDFATEAGSHLDQGPGLRNAPPGFVDFPYDVTLRSDSPAVNAGDPQADYHREQGYNGGRADLGAYGNTWRSPQNPPLDQMAVTLVTDTPVLSGQLGEVISYTLTLQNSGSVSDYYRVSFSPDNPNLAISFAKDYYQEYVYTKLLPQEQISVTVWVQFPQSTTSGLSNTILVKARGEYGAHSETRLTAHLRSFQESDGQIVMDAEHFIARTSQGSRSWLTQMGLDGYVGEGYLKAWPDTDMRFTTGYTTTSPEIQYSIRITTTGTYTIWLRGYAPNAAGDSVYISLDDQPGTILTGFAPQAWSWASSDAQGNRATIQITQPGFYTLHIWQREDGLRLDRIVLTRDATFSPNGEGPPESELR